MQDTQSGFPLVRPNSRCGKVNKASDTLMVFMKLLKHVRLHAAHEAHVKPLNCFVILSYFQKI